MGAHKLTVPSDRSQLERIRKFVCEAAREFGFSETEINKIELAVDEACSNVIRHAYGDDASRSFDVLVETNREEFSVVIEDTGKSYDILTHKLPEMPVYLREHRPGGLGIKLIRTLMDNVDYEPLHGRNRLTLTKRLHPRTP